MAISVYLLHFLKRFLQLDGMTKFYIFLKRTVLQWPRFKSHIIIQNLMLHVEIKLFSVILTAGSDLVQQWNTAEPKIVTVLLYLISDLIQTNFKCRQIMLSHFQKIILSSSIH